MALKLQVTEEANARANNTECFGNGDLVDLKPIVIIEPGHDQLRYFKLQR